MNIKQSTHGMRVILYVASLLVLTVGFPLYLLPDQTDIYFSWTINPPLTAAFLGAGYWASCVLEFLAARETVWARTRTAVPAVWLFTLLTLIVTLLHVDRFHFNAPRFTTVLGTWVWLLVYVSVPITLGLIWYQQSRAPGQDPAPFALLPYWVQFALFAQGGLMLIVGLLMLIIPQSLIPLWPWSLTPLTARAIGAWGVGVGTIAIHASRENDWWRLWPTMLSCCLYGLLQLVNLLRFSDTMNWSSLSGWIYLLLMVSLFGVGLYGIRMTRPLRNHNLVYD